MRKKSVQRRTKKLLRAWNSLGKAPIVFFKTRDTICPSFRFSGTNGLKAAVMALEMDPATFEGSFRSIALPFQAPK